jgi:hypothetical protein
MRAIWKYTVSIRDEFELQMPEGALLLSVQMQHAVPQMWAEVDPSAPLAPVKFHVVGTGNPMPQVPCAYVGTFQLHGGDLVFHLFRDLSRKAAG